MSVSATISLKILLLVYLAANSYPLSKFSSTVPMDIQGLAYIYIPLKQLT